MRLSLPMAPFLCRCGSEKAIGKEGKCDPDDDLTLRHWRYVQRETATQPVLGRPAITIGTALWKSATVR